MMDPQEVLITDPESFKAFKQLGIQMLMLLKHPILTEIAPPKRPTKNCPWKT